MREGRMWRPSYKLFRSSNGFRRVIPSGRQWHARFMLEIDALFLEYQRPFLNESMDGADIFADDAHEHHLDGGEEEHADNKGGDAHCEVIPEEQLVDAVGDRDENAQDGADEAAEGD